MNNSQTTSISDLNASEKTALDPVCHSSSGLRVPELLAPAGDWDCARAAVENGADALYFGLERFNARMRPTFTEADLPG
jgi:putative protease